MISEVRNRYQTALSSSEPVKGIRDVVIDRLVRDFRSREFVLAELNDLRAAVSNGVEENYVVAVIEMLLGWCNPVLSLQAVGYSEYD